MIHDSHCHLDLMDDFMNIAYSLEKEDVGILSVGTTPRAYLKEIEMFGKIKKIHVALGLHPQLIGSNYGGLDLFEKLVQQSHYIGEVGLDFSKGYISSKEEQIRVFGRILRCCEQYGNKVISIHSLKSVTTVLELISELRTDRNNTYILHWFTGSIAQMKRAVDLGCFFSINPKMISTKSGNSLIRQIPTNRILLETDAPFSVKVQSAGQLDNILQELVNSISLIKGLNVKNQLDDNEKRIYIY